MNLFKVISKIIVVLGISYACFMGFVAFIFSPSEFTYNHDIPQDFGGTLIVESTEIDSYEFCDYRLVIKYISYGSGVQSDIGIVSNRLNNTRICDDMGFYKDLNITLSNGVYSLSVNDTENTATVFTSNDLSSWVKINQPKET